MVNICSRTKIKGAFEWYYTSKSEQAENPLVLPRLSCLLSYTSPNDVTTHCSIRIP